MPRIAVFCGAARGTKPIYAEMAARAARAFVGAGQEIVYGGGHVGLMGVVADAALAAGGVVHGVIPTALMERELGHRDIQHLHVVPDMHARKAMMADLADGFVALPGGIGTLEEIFEQWTWTQLGYHSKPIAFLDVDGFYAPLEGFLDQLVSTGFVKPESRAAVTVASTPEAILAAFAAHRAPGTRWG